MLFETKLIISGLGAILLGVFVLFVDKGDKGPIDSPFWRGGNKDPFRQLLMDSDGKFRNYVKPLTVLLFAVFVAILWKVA